MELALGELEARPGALLAVLLALLHARVAREEAGLLETLAQLEVVDLQRTGDPVTDCAGLAARAAAVHRDDDVELVDRLRQRERLLDDHLEHFVAEVIVESAAVDRDRTRSRTNVHARRRRLPSTRTVVFNQSQEILLWLLADGHLLRALCLMRMIRTAIHLQLLQHLVTELV